MLGDDPHTFRDEVNRVETAETAETSTNRPIMLISAPDERASNLHKRLRTRLGNRTKVIEVGLGLVRSNANVEFGLGLELTEIRQRGVANFTEGIRTVRDKFSKEDLIRVEGV